MNEHRMLIRLLSSVVLLFAVSLVGVFLQSYRGRQAVISSERKACQRFDRSVLVPLLNSIRADAEGNLAVAADPKQPPRTRRARLLEAQIEARALLQMDGRLDVHSIGELNVTGQQVIRGFGSKAFDCNRSYPSASPLQAF